MFWAKSNISMRLALLSVKHTLYIHLEIICKEYFIYFAISITWGWQIFNIADISWNSFWKRNDLSLNGEHSWRGHETLGSESGESRDKGGYQKFIKTAAFLVPSCQDDKTLLHNIQRRINAKSCAYIHRLMTWWQKRLCYDININSAAVSASLLWRSGR